MYAIDLLKSAVEGLAEPDTLSDHPLTAAKFVDHYASRHPEAQSLPRGEILGRALADLWRERCLPPSLRGRLKREWNLFLTLEVGYFYPFRHNRPFPGGLPQLGGLLLDRAHVALVIADGDEARGQALLKAKYADLWEMLVPSDRKDTLALGISTVASRRDAALRRLAKELEKLEVQAPAAEANTLASAVAAEHGQPDFPQPARIDTLALYREHLYSVASTWIPEEWGEILDLARTTTRLSITGAAGSGKTELMRAIARQLCQTEAVPLYLRVCDYASQAGQMDIIEFSARQGWFGQNYREGQLRLDFEQRLAEARRADRLILFADQTDDLYEREASEVIQRLKQFPRLIMAERTPRLAQLCGIERQRQIPLLSPASAATLLEVRDRAADSPQHQIADFQQWDVPRLPGFLNQVAQAAPDDDERYPVCVVQQWINRQLTETRSTTTPSAEIDQARRMLRYLAGIRYDIAPHPEATSVLSRDNVQRAFWSLGLTLDSVNEGWLLVDFCCRAGLLQQMDWTWAFPEPVVELTLAAEYIMEQTDWVSLRPQDRALMRWTAALISRRGTAQRRQTFIQELRRALASTSQLSALEAADVLAELVTDQTAETQTFRTEVVEQLHGLMSSGSQSLSELARRKVERLESRQATRDSVSTMETFFGPRLFTERLRLPAPALAKVLRELDLPAPSSAEERWLEDRCVLRGLIDGLCQATSPDLKRDCAAWLDRAPLEKVLEVHVPEQHWWKSRTRSALEILAYRALESVDDELTRCWLYTILAREDRVLQLWHRGDEYLPLVYELLLALDQRLFLITGLLTQSEWRIMS